jgi:hypothetical protein
MHSSAHVSTVAVLVMGCTWAVLRISYCLASHMLSCARCHCQAHAQHNTSNQAEPYASNSPITSTAP